MKIEPVIRVSMYLPDSVWRFIRERSRATGEGPAQVVARMIQEKMECQDG